MGPLVLVLHPGSAGLTAQVHDNHHPGLHQQTALSSSGGGGHRFYLQSRGAGDLHWCSIEERESVHGRGRGAH